MLLRRHSTLWIVAISLLGTAAVALRWLLQETGALWTKLRFRPYLPDPDLGWRRSDEAYVWLGLDALASTFFLALAIGGAAFYLRRRERLLGAPAPRLRAILVALSLPSLVLPLLAFASGLPADEGRETRPLRRASAPESGIAGALPDLPSGSYELLPHPEAALVARLEAGGEVFEARFAGGLEGEWRGDPGDLRRPMSASISVAADSVATGIDLRDKHARGDLEVDAHPQIRFALRELTAAAPSESGGIAFRARGLLELVGRQHGVEVEGTLRSIGDALRARLSLPPGDLLEVRASFSLNLPDTAIGNDGTFDSDLIPVAAILFLRHRSAFPPKETPRWQSITSETHSLAPHWSRSPPLAAKKKRAQPRRP